MVGNGLDIVLLLLLVLGMVSGLRQGLIRLLGGVASIVLALLVSAANYKSAAFWLEKEWGIQDSLAALISSHLPALPVSVGSIRLPSLGLADPTTYLAYLALLALTFLGMFVAIASLGTGVTEMFHRIFSGIGLAGINRLLGMAVGILKSLLIMTLALGIIYPFSRTGAQMGLGLAVFLNGLIENSRCAHELLSIFAVLQGWLGLSV